MAKGVEKIHEFSLRLFVNPTLSGHGSKVSLGLLNNSILQVSILTTLDIGLKSKKESFIFHQVNVSILTTLDMGLKEFFTSILEQRFSCFNPNYTG